MMITNRKVNNAASILINYSSLLYPVCPCRADNKQNNWRASWIWQLLSARNYMSSAIYYLLGLISCTTVIMGYLLM